jgi:hypothetical protein
LGFEFIIIYLKFKKKKKTHETSKFLGLFRFICHLCSNQVSKLIQKKCRPCYDHERYVSRTPNKSESDDECGRNFGEENQQKYIDFLIEIFGEEKVFGALSKNRKFIIWDSNRSPTEALVKKCLKLVFTSETKTIYSNALIQTGRSGSDSLRSLEQTRQMMYPKTITIEPFGTFNLMRPATIRTLRRKMWVDVQTELTKRTIFEPKWDKQGTTYFHKQIDEFMFKHLQSLFEQNLMKVDDIFTSSNSSLVIYLSFSSDGSSLGSSTSSFHFSVLVSVVMDSCIWHKQGESMVKRPLPLLICNDSETVDMMFWVGTKMCEAIKIFHSCNNWIFDDKNGFERLYINNQHLQNLGQSEKRQNTNSRFVPVEFKVFLLNGDSKVQQVMCGSNSGKSHYRCYCCYRGSQEWNELEGSFSFQLPQRTISASFTSYKENWMDGNDEILKRITPRTSCILPRSFRTFSEVQNFMNEHNIWSLWVTIDALHVVSGHSKNLMDLLINLIPKYKSIELNSVLKKHCHVGFESKQHSGWKWRLIWGSFPVTWATVLRENSNNDLWILIYSWTKICKILYKSSSSRTVENWIKLVAWTLKHFCCWRKVQKSESLYFHLLWPHCIEQYWWMSFSETMTESHERTWVLLKSLWKNCASTKLSTKLMFERWVSYVDEHSARFHNRKSWISKQISEWWKKFNYNIHRVSVNLSSSEAFKLSEYLIRKSIPNRFYSINSDGHVTFDLKKLEQNDLPSLPSIEVTCNYFKNINLNQWKEQVEKLVHEHGLQDSPSSPILDVVTHDDPILQCDDGDETEERENRKAHLSGGSDSFLDKNPFELSPELNQNQSFSESSVNSDFLSHPTSSILITKSSNFCEIDMIEDEIDEDISLNLLSFLNEQLMDPEMIFKCETNLNKREKYILAKFFENCKENDVIIKNDYDYLNISSLQRLLGCDFFNEALINWYLGYLAHKFSKNSNLLILTSYWKLCQNYSPSFVSKALESNFDFEIIVAPCNWPFHWGIIGYNLKTKTGFWCEALGTYFLLDEHQKIFKNLLERYNFIEENQKIEFQRIDIPKQQDSWSCGVSTIKSVRCFCKKKKLEWNNDFNSVVKFKFNYLKKIIQDFSLKSTAK